MTNFDKLVQQLMQNPQPFLECRSKMRNIKDLKNYDFDTIGTSLANLRVLGLPLVELHNSLIALETTFTPIESQKFCIVDIETNGSKPDSAQIIEIGAAMVLNGKIIDKFQTLVKAEEIPENIVHLTHITLDDVKDAPSLKESLEKFRLFLSDAVFVAHNVNFDYNFISYSMKKAGFGPLLNRKMCSIDVAKKTIESEKYGLAFLIEKLGIEVEQHHRAYSDAYAANIVFQTSLQNLPESVISTEDLIKFANPNPKKRKKKKTEN